MSGINNSKKNDAGNLLPQRRPRLGKYIALAIMLHVVFVIVHIYLTQREPEDRSEEKIPAVKVVPVSPQKNDLLRHQAETPSAASIRMTGRSMRPPRLMSLPNKDSFTSPPPRLERSPMNRVIHSTTSNLTDALATSEGYSDSNSTREMEAWPEKQIAQRDMQFAPLSTSLSTVPSPKKPVKPSKSLPITSWKQMVGLAEPFQSPVKRTQETEFAAPARSPAMHPEPSQLSETSSIIPPQHRPFSPPQPRLINIDKITQPIIFSKISTERDQDGDSEKMPPVATSLSFPKDFPEVLQADRPARSFQTGKLPKIIQKINLSQDTIRAAVRFETAEKATYLNSEMVWQKTPERLPPLSNYAPLLPELPRLIEEHLADGVKRLTRPALQNYSEPMVRILAKNLTYRDLGLESEATKFLSGLVKAEIEKQDGVELLSPADVTRNPHIVIEGEMWDDSDEIKLRLWSMDQESDRKISAADLSFRRKMVPDKVEIQPPSGENLNMIQRMVELMNQHFPHGGDFQLGVWPDKGLDAVYLEGESLMVYIRPEKDAYLHVDYYQIDGKVVHLLPSKQESNYIKGGNVYIIGDPKSGGYEFKVSEPLGEELLVVVASQNPLGAIAHDLIEPAEPYITRLSDSLARQRKKTLMAGSHYIILTKKQELPK